MHRLEEQITRWKKQIVQAESVSQSDLTELEQHLRDAIADLRQRELSDEEAFFIASNRLGSNDALATEFGKVNGSYVWRKRVFWMLVGYLVIRLVGTWIGTMSTAATAVAAYGGLDGAIMGTIAVGVTCLGWVILVIALYALALHGGPGVSRLLSQTPSAAIALGTIAAIVVGVLLTMGGRALTARLVSANIYGQSMLVTSSASLALQVLIPIVCLVMMWSLRHRGYGDLQP